MLRDFKKNAGMPVEQAPPIERLARFYVHLGELAKGYEKDQAKLVKSLTYIDGWVAEVNRLREALGA